MSNKVISVPVLVGYLSVFWGGLSVLGVWITTNTPPPPPELKLKEANVFATTKIEVEIDKDSVDPDGNLVTYLYQWTKNGQIVPEKDGRVIPEKELTKGDVWEVTVTPNDGTLGGYFCSVPWRACTVLGENAAKLSITVKDSPPRARIRFISDEGREVSQMAGGKAVTTRFACSDPDTEKEKQRKAEAAAAAGQTLPPEPPKADNCSYEYRWVNVDVPEPEGTPPKFAGVFPPESGRPVNADGTPKPSEIVLPGGQTKSGETWKVIVTATENGVKGEPFEGKLKVL